MLNYLPKVYILYLLFDREIAESELLQSSCPNAQAGQAVPSVSLVKKKFLGKYAISAEEFSEEMVSNTILCIRELYFLNEDLMEPIVVLY